MNGMVWLSDDAVIGRYAVVLLDEKCAKQRPHTEQGRKTDNSLYSMLPTSLAPMHMHLECTILNNICPALYF